MKLDATPSSLLKVLHMAAALENQGVCSKISTLCNVYVFLKESVIIF